MTFPRYGEYKDSGVEWLGEVPAHWATYRLAMLFKQVAEPGHEALPVLSVSIHSGVSDNEIPENEMERMVVRSEDRTKYKRVEPGDLVYNMMRAWQGGFGTVTVLGMVSPAYVVARPLQQVLTAFVEMQLRSPTAVEEMRRHSRGVTDFRLRLYWEEFKNLQVALPSYEEQTTITAFLDRETAKIDELVAEQQNLIALLKEKRQALISHAVTKGLDPNSPMKDSGVAWLGEVPAHWSQVQLKRAVGLQRGHDLPADAREEGDVPVVSSGGITGWHTEARATGPGIVTGRYGTIGNFDFIDQDYWPLNTTLYTVAIHGNNPRFVWYLLQNLTPLFLLHSDKSAVPGVDRNDIHPISIVIPNINEQIEVAAFLDRETAKIDALTAEAESTITLLQERRTELISAAVTGKIDVRNVVARKEEAAA